MASNSKRLPNQANNLALVSSATEDPAAITSNSNPVDRLVGDGSLAEKAKELDPCLLLQRIQKRDSAALEALFDRYCRLVFSIGWNVLHNHSEAEDLVQDVFLFIWKDGGSFDPSRGDAHRWLITIFYRRAFKRRSFLNTRSRLDGEAKSQRLSSRNVQTPFDNGTESTTEDYNLGEVFYWRSFLDAAFESLSEDEQSTLKLYYYEGHTLQEIAAVRGKPIGTVRNWYYRGLKRLLDCTERH